MTCIGRTATVAVLMAAAILTVGCRPVPPEVGSDGSDGVAERHSQKVVLRATLPPEGLPPLGSPLPPLDDNRVEVAPPADWKVLSRKPGFLARFYKEGPDTLPYLLVTAEDAPVGSSVNTLEDMAALVESLVSQRLVGEEKLMEPVTAISLEGRPWAQYLRRGRLTRTVAGRQVRSSIERLVLTTCVADRLYTVELQDYAQKLVETRDDAYALAAGMRFLGAPTSPAATLPGEDDPGGAEPSGEDEPEAPAP
jgi:hypothetical protein